MILLCKLLITMVLVSGLKNGEGQALLILKKFIKISKVISDISFGVPKKRFMTKHLAIVIMILAYSNGFSQTFNEAWTEIKFDKAQDYKAHEAEILQCANYILSVPMNDFNRQDALNPLAKWMAGTPDYNFVINEKVTKLNDGNEFVMSVYMSSMVKFVLENKEKAKNPDEVELQSFSSMLDYMADRDHKFRITKDIQKAIDAKRKGKLDLYLKK